MAMDHNVHVVLLEYVETGPGLGRLGRAEENVRNVGADHGTAPSVRECCTHSAEHDVVRLLINAHRCPVHHLNDFAINSARCYTELFPYFLPFFGN